MISLVLMLALAQSERPPCPAGKVECKPWERQWKSNPVASPNRFTKYRQHTLIISDGQAMTRMDYATGDACQRAKDVVLAQVGAQRLPNGTYLTSSVKVFCVPR